MPKKNNLDSEALFEYREFERERLENKKACKNGQVYFSIDPMLRDAMNILWKHNIVTRYSCQGHLENEKGFEDGYIYMDFNMLAFHALSEVMFQIDDTLRSTYKIEDNGNIIWYYPYMLIERGVRKVDDDHSKDELIVRFKFHPFNVIVREEFYSIFTRLLAIALEEMTDK